MTTSAAKNLAIAEKLQPDGGWMGGVQKYVPDCPYCNVLRPQFRKKCVHCHGTPLRPKEMYIVVDLALPEYTTRLLAAAFRVQYLFTEDTTDEYIGVRDEFEEGHMNAEEYGENVRDIIHEAVSEREQQ